MRRMRDVKVAAAWAVALFVNKPTVQDIERGRAELDERLGEAECDALLARIQADPLLKIFCSIPGFPLAVPDLVLFLEGALDRPANDGPPVVPCQLTASGLLRFACIECGQVHVHGAGDGSQVGDLTDRASHCRKPGSSLAEGYRLLVLPEWFPVEAPRPRRRGRRVAT